MFDIMFDSNGCMHLIIFTKHVSSYILRRASAVATMIATEFKHRELYIIFERSVLLSV